MAAALLAALPVPPEVLIDHLLAVLPDATALAFDRRLRFVVAKGAWLTEEDGPTQVIGRAFDEIVPAEFYQALAPYYERAIAGETCEVEFVSPSTARSYWQRFMPLRDEAGAILGGLTVWQDVSERKRIESDLAQSEARYRLIAERSTDIIILLDADHRYEYLSPAVEVVTGWRPDELIGHSLSEFIHPDDQAVEDLFGERLRDGSSLAPREFRFRRRSGGYVWIEGISTPVVDPDTGQIVAVQASGRDISERKRAEELFRTLSALAPVGIFLTDAEGSCVYVNTRWTEIAGVPAEEAMGTGWARTIHPDDREAAFHSWEVASVRQRESGLAFRFLRPDGTICHVVTAAAPLRDESNEIVGYVGSVTDVTELKEAEEVRSRLDAKLQQAQKLESLGVLAGGVAHDFNNLLVGVLGNAALALSAPDPSAPARRSLEQVEIAARRAAELTRQMLAYSGKGRFVVELVDLGDLVRELAHLLEAAIDPKVELHLELPPGLPPVRGDVTQLRQVVMNLIVNAGESIAAETGVVRVSLELVDVDAAVLGRLDIGEDIGVGRYLALRVSDDGIGMEAETRARIFEPFFSTKFTGRGLGLAATLGIVRGHHGGLEVATEPGRGTTFSVYLPPVEQEEAAAPSAIVHPAEERLAGTVLLIDDDESVRIVAGRMLESVGLEVALAKDGPEAVALAEAVGPQLTAVVLDLSLPGLAGAELVRLLRANGVVAPIVVASGTGEDDARPLLEQAGLAGFLEKPFGITDLLGALRRAVHPGS